jgi:hypothetical protein
MPAPGLSIQSTGTGQTYQAISHGSHCFVRAISNDARWISCFTKSVLAHKYINRSTGTSLEGNQSQLDKRICERKPSDTREIQHVFPKLFRALWNEEKDFVAVDWN